MTLFHLQIPIVLTLMSAKGTIQAIKFFSQLSSIVPRESWTLIFRVNVISAEAMWVFNRISVETLDLQDLKFWLTCSRSILFTRVTTKTSRSSEMIAKHSSQIRLLDNILNQIKFRSKTRIVEWSQSMYHFRMQTVVQLLFHRKPNKLAKIQERKLK